MIIIYNIKDSKNLINFYFYCVLLKKNYDNRFQSSKKPMELQIIYYLDLIL